MFVGQQGYTVGLGISCIVRVKLIALGEIVVKPLSICIVTVLQVDFELELILSK